MLRDDLYDVDRALATTVAYGLATAVADRDLRGRLADGRAAARARLDGRGGRRDRALRRALSPLRRRLQRRVDRPPLPAAPGGAGRDRRAAARHPRGAARPEQLADRLRGALRDPGLRVGYVRPGRAASSSTRAGRRSPRGGRGAHRQRRRDDRRAPGDVAGARRPSSCARSPRRARRWSSSCACALELAAALREVEASRARLVQAGDHERRRLERDLHDGAQQRLVSLGMALRLAQRQLRTRRGRSTACSTRPSPSSAPRSPSCARSRTACGRAASTTACTRRSWPSTQHVPIPVDLDVQPAPLPDDVTATVYYVASEAIANAVKHAAARRASTSASHAANGHVEVRVADDGRGGARLAAGSGLAGLSDRVAAVGGRLALASEPGARHGRRGGGAVRIVIGEDSALFREGLARLLADAGHEIVGQGRRRRRARGRRARARSPTSRDRHPHAAGPRRRRRARSAALRARLPAARHPAALAALETRHSVELVASGGFGYLLKDRVLDVDDFLDALARVGRRRLGARPGGRRRACCARTRGRGAGAADRRASARCSR